MGTEKAEEEDDDDERELCPASGRLPCVQRSEKLHEEEILQQGASEAEPYASARGKEELTLLPDPCLLQQREICRGKTDKKKKEATASKEEKASELQGVQLGS